VSEEKVSATGDTGQRPVVRFAIATEAWQFEQIHRLNYATFVEEIPQHERNDERRLVDRFHDENSYVVALTTDRVVGMVCLRDRRPFSVDEKIGPFESHLPPEVPAPRHPCEIRLLAIEPGHRNGKIILGLFERLLELGLSWGGDLAIMSGRPTNMKLYRALGFRPFGLLMGTADAPFQPMFLTADRFTTLQARGRLMAALPDRFVATLLSLAAADDAQTMEES